MASAQAKGPIGCLKRYLEMPKIVQKLVLALMLPLVSALVMYQINPKLLDMSSDESIFRLLALTKQAQEMTGQVNMKGADAPSQLLNLIWTTLSRTDSLASAGSGARDPMKPLITLGDQVRVNLGRSLKPVNNPVFPLKNGDLNGILWNPISPQAIIKGKRYKVGDEISGATITGIDQASVVFSWQNKTYTLERNTSSGINVR